MKKFLLTTIIICLILTASISFHINQFLTQPNRTETKIASFTVVSGQSFDQIATNLHDQRIISNAFYFKWLGRYKNYSHRIQAGDYELPVNLTPLEVLELLLRPNVIDMQFTIPEGLNSWQIADVLLQKKFIANSSDFLSLVNKHSLAHLFPIKSETLEGYLFPNTYRISKKTTSSEILKMMVAEFFRQIKPLNEAISASKYTFEELVIIASIIEKETGVDMERPLVSAVIYNRLKKGMRLQMDPTVIYGLGANFNGNITKENLNTYNPYNTYQIKGLPPTPICNPGLESLKAAVQPAESDALYFVSKNDGTHIFSSSLTEHQNYVRKYQQQRRQPPNTH